MKASLISLFVIGTLIAIGIVSTMQQSGVLPSYIVFASDSNPDEYGNKIRLIFICHTVAFACIDASNYTSGMTVEIDANVNTHLLAKVLILKTLCDDDQFLAIDYTRVYFTISGVCSNYEGVYQFGETEGAFFKITYKSPVWSPASDTIYSVTVDYDAYY